MEHEALELLFETVFIKTSSG